jgi:hypothetical protein
VLTQLPEQLLQTHSNKNVIIIIIIIIIISSLSSSSSSSSLYVKEDEMCEPKYQAQRNKKIMKHVARRISRKQSIPKIQA